MRCRFRTKRSQQKQGWRGAGIFAVARRPPSVRYRDRVVVSHPPITRAGDGMEGRGEEDLSRAGSDRMAAADHSRRDEGSCGQRQPG